MDSWRLRKQLKLSYGGGRWARWGGCTEYPVQPVTLHSIKSTRIPGYPGGVVTCTCFMFEPSRPKVCVRQH